jgi:hypothetical protein
MHRLSRPKVGRPRLAEDPPLAIDRSSLGQDQQVVDELTVDPHTRQIADDDARPAVGGPGEGRSLTGVQPPEEANLDGERRRRSGEKLRPLGVGLGPVRLVSGHVNAVPAGRSILTTWAPRSLRQTPKPGERATGVEPVLRAWKALVQPLHHARGCSSASQDPSQAFGFATIICSSWSSVMPRSWSSGITVSKRNVIDQSGTSLALRYSCTSRGNQSIVEQ